MILILIGFLLPLVTALVARRMPRHTIKSAWLVTFLIVLACLVGAYLGQSAIHYTHPGIGDLELETLFSVDRTGLTVAGLLVFVITSILACGQAPSIRITHALSMCLGIAACLAGNIISILFAWTALWFLMLYTTGREPESAGSYGLASLGLVVLWVVALMAGEEALSTPWSLLVLSPSQTVALLSAGYLLTAAAAVTRERKDARALLGTGVAGVALWLRVGQFANISGPATSAGAWLGGIIVAIGGLAIWWGDSDEILGRVLWRMWLCLAATAMLFQGGEPVALLALVAAAGGLTLDHVPTPEGWDAWGRRLMLLVLCAAIHRQVIWLF